MDKIIIKDLIVKGNLGSNQWQYSKEQMLHFNVVGFIDFVASDNISSTISYSTIASHIQNATEKESKIKTLEALADKIALGCLKLGLEKVVLKIEKSHALLHADTVGIEITREKKHIEYLNALVLDLPFDELVLDAEDSIFIKDLMINCIIGVNPCERIEKQRVIVNITMKYNWEPTQSRSLVKNNYAVVAKKASSFIENSNYKTIEMMAEDLSSVILNQCNVEKVLVRIEKPSALMFAKTAGVEIVRKKCHSKPHSFNNEPKNAIVYIAIGTNIGNRVQNIQQAIEKLETAGISVIDTSFLYETKPMYVLDQPNFLNAALKAQTTLSPLKLLENLKAIEHDMGRDFDQIKNGPRVIDLDILFYDFLEYQDKKLTIPHPLLQERFFVLRPLADIAAEYSHPVLFRTVSQLLELLQHSIEEKDKIYKVFPIRGKLWNFDERTFVMGILNVTPDSFSDGGKSFELEDAVSNALVMSETADMIDIGGQSTRPGSIEVSVEEEIRRVIPVINAIRNYNMDIPISVDTYRAKVAIAAIEAGADLINDVSGGTRDCKMLDAMKKMGCPVCLMHMRGDSNSMANLTSYEGGLLSGITVELSTIVKNAINNGIHRWNIIIDPGIGFAKNFKQNYELISSLKSLNASGILAQMPILVGVSRKSFIGKTLSKDIPSKRVWGTAAATAISILNGAAIIRVHDVQEMKDVALVADEFRSNR